MKIPMVVASLFLAACAFAQQCPDGTMASTGTMTLVSVNGVAPCTLQTFRPLTYTLTFTYEDKCVNNVTGATYMDKNSSTSPDSALPMRPTLPVEAADNLPATGISSPATR